MKNLFQGFFNDVRTFFWFLLRGPKFYPSLIEYSFRIFKENFDTHQHADLEKEWCKDKAISITDLFNNFNLEYKNKKLFIFDESTSALDKESASRILNEINKLSREGATVILISHNDHVLEMCTRRIELKNGKIIDEN